MQSQIVLVSLQFAFAFNSKHKKLQFYTNVPKKSNDAINQCNQSINHIDADKT